MAPTRTRPARTKDDPGFRTGVLATKRRKKARHILADDPASTPPRADPVAATIAHLTPSGVPAWKLAQAQLLRDRLAEVKEEFGLLTSEAVADLAGGSMKNPSSLATRWARQGKIVAIKAGAGNLYPGFQFDLVTGTPYGVVTDLVTAWGSDDPVGLTVWCATPNEWLSGARPVDLFTHSPDMVREAIAHAVEP